MDINVLNEIIECMPKERTCFYYYDDRYAVYLMERILAGKRCKVSDLKAGRYGKLLNKPVFKEVLANKGCGTLSSEDMETLWPVNPRTFTLTLDKWGEARDYSWDQITRPGSNLVLQLNLAGDVNYEFKKFMPVHPNFLNSIYHPSHPEKTTLAWARLDVDFATDEALIEEVQNDWLRVLKRMYYHAKIAKSQCCKTFEFWHLEFCTDSVLRFYDVVVKPIEKQWAEAMLMAAIWFIWEELGIKNIYFHSFETGRVLKNICGTPPRSLYTDLPGRFCFEQVQDGPSMVMNERKLRKRLRKLQSPKWHYLSNLSVGSTTSLAA